MHDDSESSCRNWIDISGNFFFFLFLISHFPFIVQRDFVTLLLLLLLRSVWNQTEMPCVEYVWRHMAAVTGLLNKPLFLWVDWCFSFFNELVLVSWIEHLLRNFEDSSIQRSRRVLCLHLYIAPKIGFGVLILFVCLVLKFWILDCVLLSFVKEKVCLGISGIIYY